MKLAAIDRPSVVEQVVARLALVIKEEKLTAGARLPGEFELVEQLQVSRPVLREALARLQGLGLVDIQRGRGTFVGDTQGLASCVRLLRTAVNISPQELLSYTELRAAIEVQAARQAAQVATKEEVAELEVLLDQLDRDDLPYSAALEIDFQFHRRLIAIAGNPLMQNLMEVIYEFVLTQMARTTPSPRVNKLGRKLHRQVLEAIRVRDPAAADLAMRKHMEIVLQRLTKNVQPANESSTRQRSPRKKASKT